MTTIPTIGTTLNDRDSVYSTDNSTGFNVETVEYKNIVGIETISTLRIKLTQCLRFSNSTFGTSEDNTASVRSGNTVSTPYKHLYISRLTP